jgi:peroxiredoxin
MGIFRTTFLIDEKRIIRKIIPRPKSKIHASEILNYWKEIENEIEV